MLFLVVLLLGSCYLSVIDDFKLLGFSLLVIVLHCIVFRGRSHEHALIHHRYALWLIVIGALWSDRSCLWLPTEWGQVVEVQVLLIIIDVSNLVRWIQEILPIHVCSTIAPPIKDDLVLVLSDGVLYFLRECRHCLNCLLLILAILFAAISLLV